MIVSTVALKLLYTVFSHQRLLLLAAGNSRLLASQNVAPNVAPKVHQTTSLSNLCYTTITSFELMGVLDSNKNLMKSTALLVAVNMSEVSTN